MLNQMVEIQHVLELDDSKTDLKASRKESSLVINFNLVRFIKPIGTTKCIISMVDGTKIKVNQSLKEFIRELYK